MLKKEQDLTIFGLGLGLFIPLVIMLRSVEHGLGIFGFILTIAAALFILAKSVKFKVPYFIALAGILYVFFTGETKHEPGIFSYAFLVIAFLAVIMTYVNVRLLEPVYENWMKAAGVIGLVITAVILSIFYYCVFGAAGIVLRLLKKDLLDRSLDKAAATYWQKRTEVFNREHYKRQF